ncbi:MAG: hypothetical protein IJC19_03105 [Clostridia bacterium]|nr:hypothetical protein [Clostridia bacterium]
MKKLFLFCMVLVLLFTGTLIFSFAAEEEGPLSYEEYFSEERGLKQYTHDTKSMVYSSHNYVALIDYTYHLKDWQRYYTAEPQPDWLYITPLGGSKQEPLVKANEQAYDFLPDTLYYVNDEGWIVALNLLTRQETRIVKPEGKVDAMEASLDLLFFEVDRKLYRHYLSGGQTDFVVDLSPYNPNRGWYAFSNQTVCPSSGLYYNREKDRYYSKVGFNQVFRVSKGEEDKISPPITVEGIDYDTDSIEFKYRYLTRLIPKASFDKGLVMFDNLPSGEFTNNDNDILLQELSYAGIISMRRQAGYPDSENPYLPRIPAATVKKVYENIFGPGTFREREKKDISDVVGGILFYEEETDEYRFLCYSGGGGDPACFPRAGYTDISITEDSIVLLVRYATMSVAFSDKVSIYTGSTLLTDRQNVTPFCVMPEIENPYDNPDSARNRFENGFYDAYLPLYKVTFKANGDGTYHWSSTLLVEEAKTIPVELYPKEPDPEDLQSKDYKEFFGEERSLVSVVLGSVNESWSQLVEVDESNEAQWRTIIYKWENSPALRLGFWWNRKTGENNSSWQYLFSSDLSSCFHRNYVYWAFDNYISVIDLDSDETKILCTLSTPVKKMVAYEDLLFFQCEDTIYRMYLPNGMVEDLMTIPEGAEWEPVSNVTVKYSLNGKTAWYNSLKRETVRIYHGPEKYSFSVQEWRLWKAGEWKDPSESTATDAATNASADTSSALTTDGADVDPSQTESGEPAPQQSLSWLWSVAVGVVLLAAAGAVALALFRKKR